MSRTTMLSQLLAALLALSGAVVADAAQGASRLAELTRLATAGSDAAILQLLQDTVNDRQWPPEAREPLLFDFTQTLRELPPNAVGPEVLEFLSDYTPQVMVAHPDAPREFVPRYNIRAAASGVQHAWRRQQATYKGSVQLDRGEIDAFMAAYAASRDHPTRQGLRQALQEAPRAQRAAVRTAALAASDKNPEMRLLAGEAALIARDSETLGLVLQAGSFAGLAPLLQRSAQILEADQLESLLETAIEHADAAIAALAIAQFTPALSGRPAIEERLFELLDNPDLGSAAALALAADGPADRVERLSELARSDSLAGRRARMSLDLMAEALVEDRIK